jgi:hypothetical protein
MTVQAVTLPASSPEYIVEGRRSFSLHIGCLLVLLGILLSGTILELTILPQGTIVGTTRRAPALAISRLFLGAAGLYFLARRPRVTVIHLAAFGFATVVSIAVGALLLQMTYVPPRVVSGWRSITPVHEQNEFGFRGRPIEYSPEDYVVVLLGDSQVEARSLAMPDMPEKRLETYIGSAGRKVKVFSIGAGGYGQDQELLALTEYFQKYRANLVLLWQTPGNDVWNNVFNTHMFNRNPKPTFWVDDQQQLHGPSESLGQTLDDSRIVAAQLLQLTLGLPLRDRVWERSLPRPYVPLDHYEGPVRTDWQERWNTNAGRMRDENLATEKTHFAMMLAPRSERSKYGLDLTRALITRLQQLVVDNSGKLMVFQTDTHDFVSDDDQIYVLNNKFYRVSKRQFLDNWNYVNSGFDSEVIPVTVPDWRVGPEDGHLNARATDQAMAELANRLRSRIADDRFAGVNSATHLGRGKR